MWVNAPLVPMTVNGYVPAFTDRAAVTVSVDEAPLVGFGEKLPVAPLGKPLTDIVTGELKPFVLFTVTV